MLAAIRLRSACIRELQSADKLSAATVSPAPAELLGSAKGVVAYLFKDLVQGFSELMLRSVASPLRHRCIQHGIPRALLRTHFLPPWISGTR